MNLHVYNKLSSPFVFCSPFIFFYYHDETFRFLLIIPFDIVYLLLLLYPYRARYIRFFYQLCLTL
jgi:hypothetical protein